MSDFAKGRHSQVDSTFLLSKRVDQSRSFSSTVLWPTALGISLVPLDFLGDSIKTRLQASTISNAYSSKSMVEVIKANSLKNLYHGFVAGVLSKGTYLFTKMYLYQESKFMFHAGVQKVSFWRNYCGLVFSEFVGALMQSPLEIIKSRLIVSTDKSMNIKSIIQQQKFSLFTQIHLINAIKLLNQRGFELFSYKQAEATLIEKGGFKKSSIQLFSLSVIFASLAGASSSLPFDYLKTIKSLPSYDQNISLPSYTYSIVKNKKGGNLFVGFWPYLICSLIHNAAFFGIDELINQKIITF